MVKKGIDLIGVQMDLGASKRGVSMGPAAIRYGGICEGITRLGYQLHDKGDLLCLPSGESSENMRNYQQVIDINRRLYETITESLQNNALPIILGGDHSIAAGSISAVSKYYKKIGIIWIDAHGDWNNEQSTESGNMHGMPFSAVCGWGPDEMVNFGQTPVYVDPKRCVQIGGRDIDTEERLRMKRAGVTVFPINVIDKLGMNSVIEQALSIVCRDTVGFHLSFDIDAITPEAAPGTGTVVHSGLTVREAFLAVETISETGKMLSMDMVEVNPILDVRNKTGILASELVLSALGKVVF